MLRAVLDTNVLISSLLLRVPTAKLVSLWQTERFLPLVSKDIVREYYRVLAYPKFGFSLEEIKVLVERQFLALAEPVETEAIPQVVLEDPSDDMFLACAFFGKAHYLVSGDHHLLNLKSYKRIPIVSVRAFLEQVP